MDNSQENLSNEILDNMPIFPTTKQSDSDYAKNHSETSIINIKGLRWVMPYYFCFQSSVKGRWLGRKLNEVFSSEFRYTEEQVNDKILKGIIRIFDKVVPPDTKLTANMLINHIVHRHEFPVPDEEIEFIYNNDDILVVNKPAGYPVHPSGRFRHNSLIFCLSRKLNMHNLHCVHRLDRFTSGVLIFAKKATVADKLTQIIKSHKVVKTYICKVEGKFSNEIICDQPIYLASNKVGLCIVSSKGKSAQTTFKSLYYDGHHSYIACYPTTGRMHQIRVHLQYLGYPIVGDNIYGHKFAFGSNRGKGGVELNICDVINSLTDNGNSIIGCDQNTDQYLSANVDEYLLQPIEFHDCYDKDCEDCRNPKIFFNPRHEMCLHSYRYKIEDNIFETSLPKWFQPDSSLDLKII